MLCCDEWNNVQQQLLLIVCCLAKLKIWFKVLRCVFVTDVLILLHQLH